MYTIPTRPTLRSLLLLLVLPPLLLAVAGPVTVSKQDAASTSYSDPSSSSDPFSISLVSGFYGPGAFVSWILVTISAILDHLFAPLPHPPAADADSSPVSNSTTPAAGTNNDNNAQPDSNENNDNNPTDPLPPPPPPPPSTTLPTQTHHPRRSYAELIGLDLNIISLLTWPTVAAANLALYLPQLLTGRLPPDLVARVAAPLVVLRVWYGLGALVVAAWMVKLPGTRGGKVWRVGGGLLPRLSFRRDVYCVLVWLGFVFALRMAVLVVGVGPAGEEAWWLGPGSRFEAVFSAVFSLLLVCVFVLEIVVLFVFEIVVWEGTGVARKDWWCLTLIVGVWVLGAVINGVVDRVYSDTLGAEGESATLEVETVAFYAVLGFMGPVGGRKLNTTEDYYVRLISTKQLLKNKYKSSRRYWSAVDQVLWFLCITGTNPGSYTRYLVDGQHLMSVTSFLVTLLILCLVLTLALGVFPRVKQRIPRRVWSLSVNGLKVWAIAKFLENQSVSGLCTVFTTLFNLVIFAIRPDLMLPITGSDWKDLDQITAMVLNGALPMIISLRMVLVSLW